MNYKNQFIEFISTMNLKAIEKTLVNNAFKGFSNASFLEKLEKVFSELKTSGNTRLEVFKGIGVCSCNKNKKVFCFVGNKTKDYFTLSYREDESNFYHFSTSCNEVFYDNKLSLNKFYYFLIKPENTSEYKKHRQISNPIQDYKAFSSKTICNMANIELWLKTHKNLYQNTVSKIRENGKQTKLNSVELLLEKEFEILYGKLNVISILYKKEPYFKEQLENYNEVKDSVSKLKKWFTYQAENKNEYQLFSSVFYDRRALTNYRLKLDELTLNPIDFKYTVEFLNIIENNKAVQFEGIIKCIDDLEVYEKTNTRRAYSRRTIVLSVDDFYCSEYQISFSNERVKHLDNLCLGQFVKVSARLTGGEFETNKGIKEYRHHLLGWSIEKLNAKQEIKKNIKEMDLYYKYILPPPF
ncbi:MULTISPECIES: DUF3127 domain-containing protein [Bizionia]|uniref:DUF3127 domain-containing protein n=1 Tax=Bizionia algoritergicola TaxID=291187 RepID=A0A5D0R2W0_9FLAO|nr:MULTISPECIES: DUF3127 domain-containing protein [Bizionia]OBX24230.1 hypothetical protein BAA08_00055 [Bizionia sp. APA-3]TYB75151.1 DUF3127 domain-containing protein [Bizionia algoritergicola]